MNLKKDYFKFIKRKFFRLGIPFLTLSFITNFLIVLLKILTNSSLNGKEILEMIKVVLFYPETGVMGALWFLYTSIIIFAIAPLIVKLPMKFLFLATLAVNIFSPRYIHFLAFSRVCFFLVFFLIGLIFRKYYDDFKNILSQKSIVFTLAIIMILCINAYIYANEIEINTYLLNTLTFISGLIGTILIYLLVSKINDSGKKVLEVLGQHSLDIYIFSWFFQIASMILISEILKIDNYNIFFISNVVVGSLCLPFSIFIIRKVKLFRGLFLGIN